MKMGRSSSSAKGGRSRSQKKGQYCCKKHPKHRQSPGVCSLCLTQKLSSLRVSSASRYGGRARAYYCSSSSLSSTDSDSHSSCDSPVPRTMTLAVSYYSNKKKKKPITAPTVAVSAGGFWSKLLGNGTNTDGPTRKKSNNNSSSPIIISQSHPLPTTTSTMLVY